MALSGRANDVLGIMNSVANNLTSLESTLNEAISLLSQVSSPGANFAKGICQDLKNGVADASIKAHTYASAANELSNVNP